MNSILIIGAGAAGLMAAREISAAGQEVTVLEADALPGGRIRTINDKGFLRPVEAGAEFVHGEMPLTMEILRSANIGYTAVGGQFRRFREGRWVRDDPFPGAWEEVMQKMEGLSRDLPFGSFLETLTEAKYQAVRLSMQGFAEGFDLADLRTVSTRFLYREWQQEDETQYRVQGGYLRMIDALAGACRSNGCVIRTGAPVCELIWEKGKVIARIRTPSGEPAVAEFTGRRGLITVPPPILRDPELLRFSPSIDFQHAAAGKLGFGTVTRILLQFDQAFWAKKIPQLGFFFGDGPVPTWWTQYPDPNPLLTGWLPGAVMRRNGVLTADQLIGHSLAIFSELFEMRLATLKDMLVASRVVDWSTEPFVRGGYSFDTLGSVEAKHLLDVPVEDTLFFAGEALYEGPVPGTVEAALVSGRTAAEKILSVI